jgi:hypothetical protein
MGDVFVAITVSGACSSGSAALLDVAVHVVAPIGASYLAAYAPAQNA